MKGILSTLNWVDYTLMGIVLLSTVISFFRGFLREAISLISWVSALVFALLFSDQLQKLMTDWIGSELLRYVLAFIVIFVAVILLGIIINAIVHLFVKSTGFSLPDRLMGLFFGFIRGILVVLVLLMFVNMGTLTETDALVQSRLAKYFKPAVTWMGSYLPDAMQEVSRWVKGDLTKEAKNQVDSML
jgi:membrane protein required for colicin V production